jgi:hypothetical protein
MTGEFGDGSGARWLGGMLLLHELSDRGCLRIDSNQCKRLNTTLITIRKTRSCVLFVNGTSDLNILTVVQRQLCFGIQSLR